MRSRKELLWGMDLIAANIELPNIENTMVYVMSREENYDFVFFDCMPSLGMMTINALTCEDSVLIQVQAALR